jgi:hypothetical protein
MLNLRLKLYPIAALAVLIASFHFGCAKKSIVSRSSTTNIKIALMPFNVPENNKDLRWTAMVAPILIAKTSRQAQGLELIPFWQSMPVAIEKAGRSRSLTSAAVSEASVWLSAKWTIYGEFAPPSMKRGSKKNAKRSASAIEKYDPAKNGIYMIIDFMPNKDNIIPFRYMKSGRMDWVESGVHQSLEQFLRYLSGHPLEPERGLRDLTVYRNLAEALDREYGWFVDAEPGKAKEAVANLIQTDPQLARFLFNPTLYPALSGK